MRYLYAVIAAAIMLAVWGRFGSNGPIENTAMLAVFFAVLWAIVRRPKS